MGLTRPITVIAFTVLLSVIAHGLTADPLVKRYGPRLGVAVGLVAAARLGPVPERRLIRRSPVIGHQTDTTSQA